LDPPCSSSPAATGSSLAWWITHHTTPIVPAIGSLRISIGQMEFPDMRLVRSYYPLGATASALRL
jgi:hypothetical protein